MKIYLVTGQVGSYSDHNEWRVMAFVDRGEAESLVAELERLLRARIAEWFRVQRTPEFRAWRLDPANSPKPDYSDRNQIDAQIKALDPHCAGWDDMTWDVEEVDLVGLAE